MTMPKRLASRSSRIREALYADDGVALAQVIVVSAILFMLSTLMLTLVVNQQLQSTRYQARTRAVHMADAGINAYLYQLRRNPNYWVTNETLGPHDIEDGTWTVTAAPPEADTPLTLRSVAVIPAIPATRTIVATVRFPTYADYMFVTDADINIGRDAVIDGKVRANGDVDNAGRVTGRVSSAGNVTGSGTFEDGYEEDQPVVDFAQVTADLADIRTVAEDAGTYFDPSGSRGYRVTVNGTSVQVERVTNVSGGGTLTTNYVRTLTIPSEGVLYFNDTIWVSGTYGAKVTIASSEDILIPDHIRPTGMDTRFTMGLIARDNVIVPSYYTAMPSRLEITAAMLAQSGSISADYQTGTTKAKATITGSMAYRTYSGFAVYSGNTVISGFREREYNYDPRLDFDPPPMYPQIKDGSLKVNTWIEHGGG